MAEVTGHGTASRDISITDSLDRTLVRSKNYPKLTYMYSVAVSQSLSLAEVERLFSYFSHLKLTKSD